jgi:rhodanese-related sulfurtransferase
VALLHVADDQLWRLLAACSRWARAFRDWYQRPSTVEFRGRKLLREWLSSEQLALCGSKLPTKPNPNFLAQVKELFKPSDTLLVMCRSGGRSAVAVNLLTEAGFKKVYNIIDGMEGDLVDDPDNVHHGKRLKNGWKNSVLPWSYDLDPKKMRLPQTSAEPNKPEPHETHSKSEDEKWHIGVHRRIDPRVARPTFP